MKNEPKNFENKLKEWLPKTGDWRICWRATRDGWAASTFHSKCDRKSPTLTIVQVINNTNNNIKYIFGGYATEPWDINGKFEFNTVLYVIIVIRFFIVARCIIVGLLWVLKSPKLA